MELTGFVLEGLLSNSAIWGDYDNNGTLNLFIVGDNYSTNYSWLYNNNGNNTITKITNPILIMV
jgi:hypothetical protein